MAFSYLGFMQVLPILKRTGCFLVCIFLFALMAAAQQKVVFKKDPALLTTIAGNFKDAAAQYRVLMQQLPADKFPKTYFPATGKYEFSNSGWWCSGFYPGTLLYLYEQTGDSILYAEAKRALGLLLKEQANTGTHDLGFMMYNSFGNANRIRPSTEYEQVLLNSARSLSTRFSPVTGCIKSWNAKQGDFLVIIDNMMNLELLFHATKYSGDSSFYKIAVTHANTTLKNHFRADNSSYHVVNYNPQTGVVQKKHTAQGAADESAWARGQAWGLYGFTEAYRETHDPRYLQQANAIAAFMLQHPNLPADKIPYWDFNAPGIPNALRDASAAAITAAALLELCRYNDHEQAQLYFNNASQILQTLSGKQYKAVTGTNGGFILQHGVGHLPAGTEVDTPLTYADYYFVEAMKRYKEL
jgi:unsaturated chondroitin disaccharide hydrolase